MEDSKYELIFVYNEDNSLIQAAGSALQKLVGQKTACNLCNLTHGVLNEKQTWKEFIAALPLKSSFLHRDEFKKAYPNANTKFPVIFFKSPFEDALSVLLTSEELNNFKTLEELMDILSEKVKTKLNLP